MATVIKSCPKCKKTIEVTGNYLEIGSPLEECPNCGQWLKRNNINEWSLKSTQEKLFYWFVIIWTSFLYGGMGTVFLVVILVEGCDSGLTDSSIGPAMFIGWALGLIYFVRRALKDISESNKRLEDPKYRSFLNRAGFKITDI